ncbi:MAG TPA: FliM/FliN family flagellar motor switch protein [Acidiphilium sp.]
MDGEFPIRHARPLTLRAIAPDEAALYGHVGRRGRIGAITFDIVAPPPMITDAWLCTGRIGPGSADGFRFWLPAGLATALLAGCGVTDALDAVSEAMRPLLIEAACEKLGELTNDAGIAREIAIERIDREVPGSDGACLGIAVGIGGTTHLCRLAADGTEAGFGRLLALAARPRRTIAGLAVEIALEWGRIKLDLALFRQAEQGDVIVTPGRTVAIQTIEAVVPGFRRWTLKRRPTLNSRPDWEIRHDMNSDPPARPDRADTPLAAMPVELRFELGRVSRPLREIETWQPGQLVQLPELDGATATIVTIVANGARIGLGEIVMVGEDVGIQIRWINRDDIAGV